MKEIFKKIDKLSEEFLKVWEDVCNIESPSSFKDGVDNVGKYFINLAKDNSWNIEVSKQEKFGDVVTITMNPDAKKSIVTLSGHMDTVHPVGSFGTPAAHREGDKLYGPGSMDCKGGIVAGFLAMKALKACGYTDRPIRMILQSNEEVGSGLNNKDTINYICEKAKDSIAFLNLEGHEGQFGEKIALIRKGIAGFRFTVTGIESHASYCAFQGASAIREAAYKIVELEKVKFLDGITFNCGTIKGGTAQNTVARKCEFTVDVRFNTKEEYDDAIRLIEKTANTVFVEGCSCEVVRTNLRSAMELNDRNLKLFNKANELFKQSGLSTLDIGKRNGGSDAADVSSYGIPCLDSLGVGGEHAHSVNEYGKIPTLSESAKRIATIIVGI